MLINSYTQNFPNTYIDINENFSPIYIYIYDTHINYTYLFYLYI